jgi:hypothetical protein
MKNVLQRNKGFTLIEFLIYFAIVSVLIVVITGIITRSLIFKKQTIILEEISYNGILIMEKMGGVIYDAYLVNEPLKGFSSDTLSVNIGDEVVFEVMIFDVLDGAMRMKEGESDYVQLSSDDVEISDLDFFHSASGDDALYIKVQFTVSKETGGDTFEKTFYSTFNLRQK